MANTRILSGKAFLGGLAALAVLALQPAHAQGGLPPGAENWPAQCEAGDIDACINQGIRLLQGIETPVDLPGAARFASKACQLGSPDDCQIAWELYSGAHPDYAGDTARMVTVGAVACDRGLSTPCSDAALRLFTGDGVPKNVELALPVYAKACDLQDALACAILATEYLDGDQGTEINAEQAVIYGKKGCALGQPDSCRVVEAAYMLPDYSTFEPKAGLEYALANCTDGSKESCVNLGIVYTQIEEYDLAAENFDKACGMNHQDACDSSKILKQWRQEVAEYEAYLARLAEQKAAINGLIASSGHDAAMNAALNDYGSTELAQYVASAAGSYSGFSTSNLYVLSYWFPGQAIGEAANRELASRGTGLEGQFGEGTNTAGAAEARYRAAYGSSPPSYSSPASSASSAPPMKSAAQISAETRDRYRWAHCTMSGSNRSAKVCQ
ncbi:sel1 repeat family protein [Hyphomonas sp. WL0036]|uniref:tetratricopeptide repeat protein n=1 Tax=Hyphomonas sediminis TaxID=2866160 RepID=UPI001C823BF8|nr:tetratricopeptide repeat protein [Hyphomonas sediminis]MBY9068350.1 sel1 repeat family protein [Hyphomonas sediminis]